MRIRHRLELIALVLALTSAVAFADGKPVRYLALGDSFTIGTGSKPEQAFPAVLIDARRQKGIEAELDNLAVNGFSTKELIDLELPEWTDFEPTVVTLAIGANDIVRGRNAVDYRANLKKIFAALKARHVPAAQIVCLPQPDWSQSPVAAAFGTPQELLAKIVAYNTILSEEAKTAGARYVDLFPLMKKQAQQKMVAPDGLHPNADAHHQWADALEQPLFGK